MYTIVIPQDPHVVGYIISVTPKDHVYIYIDKSLRKPHEHGMYNPIQTIETTGISGLICIPYVCC